MRLAVEYWQQLIDIRASVDDTHHSAGDRLVDISRLLEGFSARPPASHVASVRKTLTEDRHHIRNLLAALRGLGSTSNGADPTVQQLEFVGSLHDRGAVKLPPDCQVPVSVGWRGLAGSEGRRHTTCATEVSTILDLYRGLRYDMMRINHSLSFRERN